MPEWLTLGLAAAAIAAWPAMARSQEAPASPPGDELIGREAFPAIFHGVWATTLADCDGNRPEMIEITARLFSAYEARSVLLRGGGIRRQTAPDGRPAFAMNALVRSSSEGEVGNGRLRLIRVGDILYTSNPEVVSEADQYLYPHISCPQSPR
jgi:hypothetical protein